MGREDQPKPISFDLHIEIYPLTLNSFWLVPQPAKYAHSTMSSSKPISSRIIYNKLLKNFQFETDYQITTKQINLHKMSNINTTNNL
ncbi:hypothetical protein Hanom_Chr15g01413881 [Helianthus anomalus]